MFAQTVNSIFRDTVFCVTSPLRMKTIVLFSKLSVVAIENNFISKARRIFFLFFFTFTVFFSVGDSAVLHAC